MAELKQIEKDLIDIMKARNVEMPSGIIILSILEKNNKNEEMYKWIVEHENVNEVDIFEHLDEICDHF